MSVQVLLDRIDRVRGRERIVQVAAGAFRTALALLAMAAGFFLIDWLVVVLQLHKHEGVLLPLVVFKERVPAILIRVQPERDLPAAGRRVGFPWRGPEAFPMPPGREPSTPQWKGVG